MAAEDLEENFTILGPSNLYEKRITEFYDILRNRPKTDDDEKIIFDQLFVNHGQITRSNVHIKNTVNNCRLFYLHKVTKTQDRSIQGQDLLDRVEFYCYKNFPQEYVKLLGTNIEALSYHIFALIGPANQKRKLKT